VKESLVGSVTGMVYFSFTFPIVPWLSLNLAATVLGERIADCFEANEPARLHRVLGWTGMTAFAASVVLKITYLSARIAFPANATIAALRPLASPFQKYPPSPTYFLFYGAVGALLLLACFIVAETEGTSALRERVGTFGQTSLFVFLTHWYVDLLGIAMVRDRLPFKSAWPIYFVLSSALIIWAAFEWQRRGYNRFFTVHYEHTSHVFSQKLARMRRLAPMTSILSQSEW
jgi:hypothetical protein